MAERTGSSKRKGRFGSNLEGNSEVLRSWGWVYEVYEFMKRLPKQTSISTLDQCFSNCGPWTSNIYITWVIVRNTNSMAKAEDKLNQYLNCVTSHSVFTKICRWFGCIIELRPGLPNAWILFPFYFSVVVFFSNQSSKIKTMTWKENVMQKIAKYFFL